MEDIKVSVIIPTYNRYDYLIVAINSVKNQTHKNTEIIVINDASTDNRYYTNKIENIILINLEENSRNMFGKPCAGYVRNFGLRLATGNYVAFLDDDDYWFPNKLETQLKTMINNNILMACSDGYKGVGIYDETKFSTYVLYSDNDKQYDMEQLELDDYPVLINRKLNKKRNIIYCSSCIVHISIIKKAGLMDHVRNGKEDSGYWQKCLTYTDCVRCKEPLFFYSLK